MGEGRNLVRLWRIYLTCQGSVGKASKACCSGQISLPVVALNKKRVNMLEINKEEEYYGHQPIFKLISQSEVCIDTTNYVTILDQKCISRQVKLEFG